MSANDTNDEINRLMHEQSYLVKKLILEKDPEKAKEIQKEIDHIKANISEAEKKQRIKDEYEKKKQVANLASEAMPGLGTIVGAAANKKLNQQENHALNKASGKKTGWWRTFGADTKAGIKDATVGRAQRAGQAVGNFKDNLATRAGRQKIRKKIRKKFDESDVAKVNGLYALAIFIHFLDVFVFGFSIDPTTIIPRTILYLVLAIAAHNVYENSSWTESIMQFGPLFLITVIGIPLVRFYGGKLLFDKSIADTMSGFILAIPFWLWYFSVTIKLRVKDKGFFVKLFKYWVTFLFILALINISILSSWNISKISALQTTAMSPQIAVDGISEYITTSIKKLTGTVTQIVNDKWNKTMGGFYGATVEDSQGLVGPEIASFDSLNAGKRTYYPDQDIDFRGTIVTKGIREDVHVNLSCEAIRTSDLGRILTEKDSTIKGTATSFRTGKTDFTIPSYKPENYEEVDCKFDKGALTPGRYTVKIIADFDFTTEGYVKFTFMTSELARALGQDNIYSKYSITRIPESKFTNGPISVTMSLRGQTNPIILSSNTTDTNFVYVGLEMTNKDQGFVKDIKSIDLMVPKELNVKCGKNKPVFKPDTKVFDYSRYTSTDFPDAKGGIKTKYPYVCGATIKPQDVKSLIPQSEKPQDVLIASSIAYDYEMTRAVSGINVLKATG